MTFTQENRTYTITCDVCGKESQVKATAITEPQFKKLFESYGWIFDSEQGDVCKKCARAARRTA